MKKIVFVLILIPPALLYASCGEVPSGIFDDPDIPDVIITEDWRYITIYLDGAHLTNTTPAANKLANSRREEAASFENTPVNVLANSPTANSRRDSQSESRGMTPDTARRGFDFFEAVFCSNGVIVRAAWEIGTRASVYGVYRTASGVNYSQVSLDSSGNGTAALLFAGRKRDKTLLAVGKIVSVDDVPGTTITSASSSVTFEVFALTGKLNHNADNKPYFRTTSYDAQESCFLTQYDTSKPVGADNTLIMNAIIGGRAFPLYKLPEGKTSVKAQYVFELDGMIWADFAGGVLVSSVFDGGAIVRGTVTLREARYPAGNGKYWYAVYPLDITTNGKMTNNQTVGLPVDNYLMLDFDTSKTIYKMGPENGLFTMGFRIPVSPLIAATKPGFVSPSEDGDGEIADDVTWFIRPAYQSYYYNIDNGVDSYGGGVLMGAFGAHEAELIVNRRWG